MARFDELLRYDGRHVVVTGCASGIGAAGGAPARRARRPGDRTGSIRPTRRRRSTSSSRSTSPTPASIDGAGAVDRRPVDALFNVAGVSSGIGDPLLVVRINFLGTRQFTEALVPRMPPGSAIASVSSLAASSYRENASRHSGSGGHRDDGRGRRVVRATTRMPRRRRLPTVQGGDHPLRNGQRRAHWAPGESGSTARHRASPRPPILDQLRSAYGQGFWTRSARRWAGSPTPRSRPRCWYS